MQNENLKTTKKLAGNYLQVLETFRNDFIDDIPSEMVDLDDPNYHFYKCRKNFFVEIIGIMGLVLRDGVVVEPTAAKKALEFMDFVQKEITTRQKITEQDIAKANEILDIIIGQLKKRD